MNKKTLPTLLLILILAVSCNEQRKKKYEEYRDGDFIEVQGIITKSISRTNFSNLIQSDIYFIYDLEKQRPNKGYELQSPFILNEGEPVIILVHKDNEDVSFFGSRGIIDEGLLLSYLKKCEEIGGGYYGVDD